MEIFRDLLVTREKGEGAALCTILETHGSTPRHQGSRMVVYEDGSFTGTVGGGEIESRIIQEALEALKDGQTRRLHYNMVDPKQGDPGICGGQVEVYVEPFLPQPSVLVIGGGHVGKAVAHLAKWLDFRVIVSDDRPEFCTPQANPEADSFFAGPMQDIPNHVKMNSQTYIILTTRGVLVDVPGMPALLASPHAYLGVIGSKRRWSMTRKALIDAGVPEDQLDRVNSPIGLELGAETPEEIAVSIMAEILALRNKSSGKSMKM